MLFVPCHNAAILAHAAIFRAASARSVKNDFAVWALCCRSARHSKKNGKRLRYYISHRLVKDRSRKHPDAWRLPAEQLEELIADLLRKRLKRQYIAARYVRDLPASETMETFAKLETVKKNKAMPGIDRRR